MNMKWNIKCTHVSEIWRGMPGQKSVPSFENGKCVFEVPVDIEDFINQFSVTYGKGSFILKGSFQGRTNYHLRTSVGTDMGICASINPVVSVQSGPYGKPLCKKNRKIHTRTLKVLSGSVQFLHLVASLNTPSPSDWLQPSWGAKHGDTSGGEQHQWGEQRTQIGDWHRGLWPRIRCSRRLNIYTSPIFTKQILLQGRNTNTDFQEWVLVWLCTTMGTNPFLWPAGSGLRY